MLIVPQDADLGIPKTLPLDRGQAARPIDRVIAASGNASQQSDGSWLTNCPVHGDANPSCVISEADDGKVLIICRSQRCPVPDIVEAWGLDMSDLFPGSGRTASGASKRWTTADLKANRVAPYPVVYVDEHGAPLFLVARFDVLGEKKKYPQFRLDARGYWIKGLEKDTRKPLFRLPTVLREVAAGATIHVVEGEKCVAAMYALGLVATTNSEGAGCWSAEHTATLRNAARVVVWPDNDEGGRRHGYAVADALVAAGVPDVRIVELEGRAKYDVADWVAEREGDLEAAKSELLAMVEKAKPHVPAETKVEEKDGRPAVRITTESHKVADAAVAALPSSPASFYWRGQSLVRVTREASRPSTGILRAEGTPAIAPVRPETMVEILSASARFETYDARRDGWRAVPPPITLARTVLERGEWPGVRPLVSVTESPAVRPDGSVAVGPGYDDRTGVLILPGAEFPDVKVDPSARCEVEESMCLEAAIELARPFFEYPYHDRSVGLAATVALIMTIACRTAIPGVVPMFPITSTTPRSGKGKLARAAAIIGTGRPPVPMVEKRSGEEWDKTLATCASEGTPVLLIDNVEGVLRAGELAAAITFNEYYARKLGTNSKVGGPWNTVVVATGNNLTLGGDLAFRCVPIRIVPTTESPDQTDFKFDPVDLATRERPRLFMLAIRIFEAFAKEGMPHQPVTTKMGGFEEWDRRIRHAVVWSGLGDPLGGRETLIRESDADLETARVVLDAWREAFPEPVTVAEALRTAEGARDSGSPLRDALALLAFKGAALPAPRYLGAFLRRYRNRIVAGMTLLAAGESHSATLWKVEGGAS